MQVHINIIWFLDLAGSILQLVAQPIQALVQTISRSCTSGLNVPVSVPEAVEPKLVCDLGCVHGVGQVLLVGEYQQHGLTQLILCQHPHQLVPRLSNTLPGGYIMNQTLNNVQGEPVVAVHHEDESLGVLEVMSPQRTDLVLTADVPHGETDVLVFNSLDIEPNSWDGGDDLSQLELIKNGGFTSSIKPHHENPHLLLAEEALEKGGEHVTHGCTDMTAGVVWRKFSSLL